MNGRERQEYANGTISWTATLRRNTTVSAVYTGDARSAPRTVSVTAGTKVAVSTSVSRAYKTQRIGGTPYHWFHEKSSAVVSTRMTPHADRRARLDFQARDGGRCVSLESQYFDLDRSGRTAVRIPPPGVTDVKARVRFSYVRRGSGDSLNTTTHGPWRYLYWTK